MHKKPFHYNHDTSLNFANKSQKTNYAIYIIFFYENEVIIEIHDDVFLLLRAQISPMEVSRLFLVQRKYFHPSTGGGSNHHARSLAKVIGLVPVWDLPGSLKSLLFWIFWIFSKDQNVFKILWHPQIFKAYEWDGLTGPNNDILI